MSGQTRQTRHAVFAPAYLIHGLARTVILCAVIKIKTQCFSFFSTLFFTEGCRGAAFFSLFSFLLMSGLSRNASFHAVYQANPFRFVYSFPLPAGILVVRTEVRIFCPELRPCVITLHTQVACRHIGKYNIPPFWLTADEALHRRRGYIVNGGDDDTHIRAVGYLFHFLFVQVYVDCTGHCFFLFSSGERMKTAKAHLIRQAFRSFLARN